MDNSNRNKKKRIIIVAILSLFVLVLGASYAYFQVTTINNFGTSNIWAETADIGSVIIEGNDVDLVLNLTADQLYYDYSTQNPENVIYYAGESEATTTPTEVVIGTARVQPSTDSNYYHCTYNLSVTHTGTNDMYDVFNHKTNDVYDYTNRSEGQIALIVNGQEYDWASTNGMPSVIPQDIVLHGANTKNITAGLKFVNDMNIDQEYITGTDINITITMVPNSLQCEIIENPIAYINRQNANQITTGDEISIGNENFYVVSSNSTETALLAKYLLKQDQTNYIQETDENYSNSVIKVNFADSNGTGYWDDANCVYAGPSIGMQCPGTAGLKAEYANASNLSGKTGNYISTYPYVYDSNAVNLYPVVNAYANKIGSI